jgi:cytochrome c oxidase subunit III
MEIPYAVKPRPDTGLYNAKVGIWLFLASEVMLFGALFSSYILLRVNAEPGTWPHHWLNVWLGMTNTIVLILSSVTVVMSWASLKMGEFGKYRFYQSITVLCAFIFLGIKSVEYRDKFHHYEIPLTDGTIVDGHIQPETTADTVVLEGYNVKTHDELMGDHSLLGEEKKIEIPRSKIAFAYKGQPLWKFNYGPWHNTYTAIYFTLTGLHALHVIGGAIVIFAILFPLAKVWRQEPERYTNRVEVSGLFWHFVDLVWIFLFPVLYLL